MKDAVLRVIGALSATAVASSAAFAAEPFMHTSPAFKDGDIWSNKYAGADPSRTNPPCPGQNVLRPLAWSHPPVKTKSFALIMRDPDGGNGLGVTHWIAYGIPASVSSLAEGSAGAPPKLSAALKGRALGPASIVGRYTRRD